MQNPQIDSHAPKSKYPLLRSYISMCFFARIWRHPPSSSTRMGSAVTTTVASIQRFLAHEYDAGELGRSRFSVASVHQVGILDVRLLNIDRHAGILVKNQMSFVQRAHNGGTSTPPLPLDLVPLDHDLCLTEQLDDLRVAALAAGPFARILQEEAGQTGEGSCELDAEEKAAEASNSSVAAHLGWGEQQPAPCKVQASHTHAAGRLPSRWLRVACRLVTKTVTHIRQDTRYIAGTS